MKGAASGRAGGRVEGSADARPPALAPPCAQCSWQTNRHWREMGCSCRPVLCPSRGAWGGERDQAAHGGATPPVARRQRTRQTLISAYRVLTAHLHAAAGPRCSP